MKFRKIVAVALIACFAFALPVQAQNPWSTAAFQAWKQSITASGRMGAPRIPTASLPTCDADNLGMLVVDTTTSTFKVCDGTTFDEMGSFAGGAVTTPITAADGTAGAPSYAFTTDADGTGTGMFLRAAGVLGFSTNGTQMMEVTNVGAAIVRIAAGSQYVWGGTTVTSAPDVGLERIAAGAIAPTNGTTGLGAIAYTQQAVTVDSATTFAATSNFVILACTGAETINTITGGVQGLVLYIEHTDSECTIADDDSATASNAIDLTGTATNDVGATAKFIVLIYNGTHWSQISESDN